MELQYFMEVLLHSSERLLVQEDLTGWYDSFY